MQVGWAFVRKQQHRPKDGAQRMKKGEGREGRTGPHLEEDRDKVVLIGHEDDLEINHKEINSINSHGQQPQPVHLALLEGG
jgi:hypothetical protein